ncbi:uncharacterized protein LOC127254007 isoform X2 [Andrographis paniculata]|uniref:uncharacterized protein LOC127254007 isoform X2 n=1 Tax=Andrographis paniculata TaxID=175694 RepID=UPI0021E97AF4|nr:uncharacterized protein LOC127254007 isoform X2 [Andrographis paniculata]
MASSIRPETRYAAAEEADASSSSEFTAAGDLSTKNGYGKINLGFTVKKFVDSRMASRNPKLADIFGEDLKKAVRKGAEFGGGLQKKFANSKKEEQSTKKALTEVKSNTRTLGMVLRSERELLSKNKEQEELIFQLKLLLEQKITEVEKLKDLCLKQREEIKSLKSASNSHDLEIMVVKQGCELKQAKELIPSLQKQVTSLTGQLRCLADDLAEVKARKCYGRGISMDQDWGTDSTTSASCYRVDDGADSLEFCSGGDYYTTPEDEMLVKDLNPCLTPYTTKSSSSLFDDCDSPWGG